MPVKCFVSSVVTPLLHSRIAKGHIFHIFYILGRNEIKPIRSADKIFSGCLNFAKNVVVALLKGKSN